MIVSAETQSLIAQLRAKGVDGTLTKDDMRLAVKLLRSDRMNAAQASATSRRKVAKTEIPDANSLLDQLDNELG